MSYNYKKTYTPAKGYTPVCKIGECSLKKLEFGIIELDAGESLTFDKKLVAAVHAIDVWDDEEE